MRGLIKPLVIVLWSGASWAQEEHIGVWGIEDDDGYFLLEFRNDGIAVSNEFFKDTGQLEGWVAHYGVSGQTFTVFDVFLFRREDVESEWIVKQADESTFEFAISDGVFSYSLFGKDETEDPLPRTSREAFIHEDAFAQLKSTVVQQASWGQVKCLNECR